MFKKLIAKGNVHRSDYQRALLSDTAPGDIPIIVSNDGFYRNLRAYESKTLVKDPLIARIFEPTRSYTKPYRYNILRGNGDPRRLSLVHPSAQSSSADFYRQYGNLVCYYARKSPASLRAPTKVGSLFFVRGSLSDKNQLKSQTVDTVDLESTVSNPASYFAYRGHSRAHQFFQSMDFLRLERKYHVMYFADVANCFASIYTHTLYWAVADIQTAKDSTQALSFSNSFDRLMQSMNYNETNGICVGSEISRIFAELILARVDANTIKRLADIQKLKFRSDYEFRRYVDDYFIFASDERTARKVLNALSTALAEFNLGLNGRKTVEVRRPFITVKTRLARDANSSLEEFFGRFIGSGTDPKGRFSYPLPVRNSGSLLRSLIESIKSSCFDQNAGYDTVSNYVIGALAARVGSLIRDYPRGRKTQGVSEQHYVGAIALLLEALYFFYNLDPTIPSSLRVAQAAIQSSEFFRGHVPQQAPFLDELLVRWTYQFVKSVTDSAHHLERECVPLDALNLLVVLGEVARTESLAEQLIREFSQTTGNLRYFEIVCLLYCIRDDPRFDDLRGDLLAQSRSLIFGGEGLAVESEAAHLALDVMACPYIEATARACLYNDLLHSVGRAKVSAAKALAAIGSIQANPWFVDWSQANLLRMIRKKELSSVY